MSRANDLALSDNELLAMIAKFADKVHGTSGYQKLPGGLILQWGEIGITTAGTVTFPVAFPSAILRAIASPILNASEAPSAAGTLVGIENASRGLTSMKINCSNAGARLVEWFAIGK